MSSSPTSETIRSSESTDPPMAPLENTPLSDNAEQQHIDQPPPSQRPLRRYTRRQLVSLSESPLVKPPPNMPELKVWFGSENENIVKKDEPPTPNATRERRFRRDAEDGDTPVRPTFRAALTQPSQMGNFKHQSLRANDRERDRDREGEKVKIGDTTRLQDLSDRYDRDRLATPLTGARNKERDPAPHLGTNGARSVQALSSNAASRRAETREATKKKVGEASEDWRRGAEPPRTVREDRTENGRERARSRVRDSSRAKRESSASRKERERDEPRERLPRSDRERDRREKDDPRRDREVDEDDVRRWRDDGKHEDRITRRDRGRDKTTTDSWEGATDKRWTPGDDRDSRYKRTTGRDRKGNGTDDVKDKDERRDKEKEKEPAWMDTYVPSESSPGILGGQASAGQLDGIQAWKKGMKEKEHREKEASIPTSSRASVASKEQSAPLLDNAEKLDEIQLFKLMMKKEQETKRHDEVESTLPVASKTDVVTSSQQRQLSVIEESLTGAVSDLAAKTDRISPQAPSTSSSVLDISTSSDLNSFHPGLKDLSSIGQTLPPIDSHQERNLPRLFATSSEILQNHPAKPLGDLNSNPLHPFQPPAGSRLLAFAARPAPKAAGAGNAPTKPNLLPSNGSLSNITSDPNQTYPKNEPLRPPASFSPFEEQTRQSYMLEDVQESRISHQLNAHHRASLDQNYGAQPELNLNGMAAGKGSRFAKFFDGKARDGTPVNKPQASGGPISPSPNPNQRPDQGSFNGLGPNTDQRTMEDIYAMLSSSSQQRTNLPHLSNAPQIGNNGGFGTQGPGLHAFQQPQHFLQQQQLQQQQQQQQHHNTRLEPLYDSRGDDRSFVPDGMVPGLRPVPALPARGRDNGGHFEQVDEQLQYNLQRLAQQQQQQQQVRNLDPLYAGPTPPIFAQQAARHGGLPLQALQQQQPHYRGGPSPTLNQVGSLANGPQQQRLPPGLANLGGRPPHEPAQFLGLSGHPTGGPHNALHTNGPLPQQQHPYNNFSVGNVNFNGSQARGPGPAAHLHNAGLQQHPLGNLVVPHMDPRLATHNHLMGLGGSGVGGNRINGFPQGPTPPSHLGMRPQHQQQPQMPPHMLPHLMPPHLQQQGQPSSNNQTQDLMALLMGGPHRE